MSETLATKPVDRPVPILQSDLGKDVWSTEVTIRFGHCDPAGIVYTPRFFDLFNAAIEEWYGQSLGIDYYELIGERRIGLGYVNAHADFFAVCEMGNKVTFAIKVEHVGRSSFVLSLHGFRDGAEAVRGRLTVVTTDLGTHRPMAIPSDLRDALLVYAGS